ncbi:Holliday junction resolvase YqgF [Pirellula staleyi DSM 6068]|uniref:Putative pre-16S rRNA nuclease n=1 Tax=Pirellula staleyi (strain ATCC 27377 / DSM 6068 / ICPB 4128) TaxID=530564 RepID=D2R1W7_PIRSD|nr:Holliday junction resolvase RuvX [Pirellula staleyi]ADB18578.1 Holliday junction resolvase YqgF [Pirellula staleyi DSM 6068]
MRRDEVRGRLIGVDYGTVRIGLAITDPEQKFASPLDNYTRRGGQADARYFQRVAQEERAAAWVVGLPVHTTGSESQKSTEARQFAKQLEELTKLPVFLFDERFTSADAEEMLIAAGMSRKERKSHLDKLAAQILLSAFLRSEAPELPPRALDD